MNAILKPAIATIAMALLFLESGIANAQDKRDSEPPPKKRVPRLPPHKPRVQPDNKPLPKAPSELRRSLPPDSNRPVPRAVPPGKPRVTPGVTDRNELRRQRGGLGAPGIAGRGPLGPTTSPPEGAGRRWLVQPGVVRTELYRRRSRGLATQMQVEIPARDARTIGVRSKIRAEIAARRPSDWRNWRADYVDRRYRWYRGSWGGDWYGRWNTRWQRAWTGYPIATSFGITPWGLNRMGYWFGYRSFQNPYYVAPVVVGSTRIDYSQPLVAQPPTYDTKRELADFDDARAAFKRRDYSTALRLANRAAAVEPHDSVIHEFRALALFAIGDYDAAAEALYPVLAVGPGWDWQTVRGLYASRAEYTRHLRKLEGFVRDHRAGYVHFLLGYHYMATGYSDAALAQFRRAVALNSKDQVSRQLVSMIGDAAGSAKPIAPRVDKQAAIPVKQLVGTWTAKQGDREFTLQLTDDMRFVWKHRAHGRTTQVTGAFAVENGTLALEPEAGGVMIATISMTAPDRLRFKMIGNGSDDSGLTFSK